MTKALMVMHAKLTIADVSQRVLDALRSRAEQDNVSIEQAAADVLNEAVLREDDEAEKVDRAWAEEVERRIDALDRGEAHAVDGEQTLDEIEAELGGRCAGGGEVGAAG